MCKREVPGGSVQEDPEHFSSHRHTVSVPPHRAIAPEEELGLMEQVCMINDRGTRQEEMETRNDGNPTPNGGGCSRKDYHGGAHGQTHPCWAHGREEKNSCLKGN